MYKYRQTLYQNYYSNHAGTTDKDKQQAHFDQQKRYFVREFKNHVPANRNLRVLDIGCGSGSLLAALSELGFSKAYGVDLSEEQVAMAAQFGVKNVVQGDAKSFLDKQNEGFDLIFAVDLIEHLGKDELIEFLQLVQTKLNSGGQVIFRTPNMDAPLASAFAFADFTHEVFLNKSSANQIMKSVGFDSVQVVEGIMFIENPMKEFIRKITWSITKLMLKIQLFASARTWHDVVFSPNMVIIGRKS